MKEIGDLKRFAEEVTNKINSYIRGLEDDNYTSSIIKDKQIRDYEFLIIEINDLLRKYENDGNEIL